MKEGPLAVALAPQLLTKGPLSVFKMENKSGGKYRRTGSSPLRKKTPSPSPLPLATGASGCAPAAAPPKEDTEPGKYAFLLLSEHCYRGRQGNRLYRCDVCGGVYRHAFSLKRHYLRSHVNYIYLSHSDISNCGINMPASGVAELLKQTQASGVDVPMPGLFRCHLCGALFHSVDELKGHVAQHPATAASVAPIGGVPRASTSPLAQTPTDRKVSCPQCRATFPQRQYLTRHLASAHSGEKPFLCRHCGKGFPTVTNQRRHERIHEGLKPYACLHCPAGFTQSGDLKKHIRSMHSDRFHPCTLCRKYFSAAVALVEHTVACHGVGNAETPPDASAALPCGVCSKKLASFPALCRHYRMCHPKVKYSMTSSRTAIGTLKREEPVVTVLGRPLVGEAYFYANVSRNISDNLQHHIDGKIAPAMHPDATPTPPPEESDFVEDTQVPSWSHYNFPVGFSMSGGVRRAQKFPSDYNGLTDGTSETPEEYDDDDALDLSGSSGVPQTPESEPEESLRVKTADSVFVCYVCGERFDSTDSIEVHKINNHPNVFCTHLELEGVPQSVPYELFKHRCSPEGALGRIGHVTFPGAEEEEESSSRDPPSARQLNCTKCGGTCGSVPELHEHILACGVDPNRAKTARRTPLFSDRRVIRRGMKRRLEGSEERYARYTRRNGAIVLTSTPTSTKAWSATCSVSVPLKRSKRLCSKSDSGSMITRSADGGGGRMATDCRSCGQVFHHRSGLLRHQRFCQQRSEPSPSDDIRKQHGCPHCGRHFTYMASLRKHVNGICPQRPVPDPVTSGTESPPEPDQVKVRGNSPKKASASPVAMKTEEPEEVSSPLPVLAEAVPVAKEEEDEERDEEEFGSEDFLELKPMAVEGNGNFNAERDDVMGERLESDAEEETAMKNDRKDEDYEAEEEEDDEEEEEEDATVPDADEEVQEAEAPPEQDPQDEENKAEDSKKDIQHSCPNCHRSFTYLANFKKHVNELCPLKERQKLKGAAAAAGKGEAEEPKKTSEDEGEDVGNGSAATDTAKSSPPLTPCRARPQVFPCTICHRTFYSYVYMLKHRLSHKLKIKTSSNLVGRDDSLTGEGGPRSKRLAGRVHRNASKGLARGPRKAKTAPTDKGPSVVIQCSDGNNSEESAKKNVVMDKAHISVFRNAIRSKVKGFSVEPDLPMPEVTDEVKTNSGCT